MDWMIGVAVASSTFDTVRILRVFVSSPGDVAEERAVMDEVVASINRTDGQTSGFRLELFRWEDDVIPQIGPKPQQVVDQQTPVYDIYVGIMSTRFGTPAGRNGSGTEKEFKDALKRWKRAGAPWITFYFDDAPSLSSDPAVVEKYLKGAPTAGWSVRVRSRKSHDFRYWKDQADDGIQPFTRKHRRKGVATCWNSSSRKVRPDAASPIAPSRFSAIRISATTGPGR